MPANIIKLIQSGIGIVLSSIFGIGLVKVLATKGGPETLGYFGVFRQFFQLLTVIFTLGNGYAVIEGLPKTLDIKKFTQTVSSYTFWTCTVLSIIILFFSAPITHILFGSYENINLIRMIPFMIFTVAYTLLMRSIYAGQGKLIQSGIFWSFSYFFMFLVSLISTQLDNLYFYGSVISFFIAIIFFKDRSLLTPKIKFERNIAFEKTAVSTAITGLTGFFSFLVVRAICINKLGPDAGGLLESSWNLINYCVLVFLTSLSSYYLPQISARPSDIEFRKKFFKIINGFSLTSLIFLCWMKPVIIPLLFSKEFLPAANLVVIMSIGEYLKCLNYFFIFSLIGISRKRPYLLIDSFSNFLFIALTFILPIQELESFGYIYVAYQAFYLICSMLLNYKFKIISINTALINLIIGLSVWSIYLFLLN